MIKVTDINGRKHYFATAAISQISEATASAAWHGIRTFLRTFDGQVLEVQEAPDQIEKAMLEAAKEKLMKEGG